MNRRARIITGSIIGVLFGLLTWFDIGADIEGLTVDFRLRMKPEREVSDLVQVVAVGDEDIERLGQWPIPRGAHVNVIQILHALGVKNTCFDIVFSESSRDPEHDEALKEVVAEAGNVTLAYYFQDISPQPQADPPPHFIEGSRYGADPDRPQFMFGYDPKPLFADFGTGLGAVNAKQTSGDKVVRRVPLFISYGGKLYPSIAMQAVIQAFALEPDQITVDPGRFVTLVGTPNGTIRIPIDDRCQIRVNLDGSRSLIGKGSSYLDLFALAQDAEQVESAKKAFGGSVVFVGNASTGSSDIVLSRVGPLPGVAVQASVAENIISGHFLKTVAKPVSMLLVIAGAILMALSMRTAHPWQTVFALALIIGLWSLASWWAIRSDLILPFSPVAGSVFATMLVILPTQISGVINKFSGYVPSALRSALLSSEATHGQPQRGELTIFFSDIRGFTSWSEEIDPGEVAEVLNEYLAAMAEVAEEHGGTVDKFIGDCVMVFFGAPVKREDHAVATLRMAWEMQSRIATLNKRWEKLGRKTISVGMGLNTDYVTFGNFGSHRFKDYTVIGRGVNLAARVESIAPGGHILLTKRTSQQVQEIASTRLFAEVRLKGIPDPVPVFEVLAVEGMCGRPDKPGLPVWEWEEDGEVRGPFPKAGIEAMYRSGRVFSDTLLRKTDTNREMIVAEVLKTADSE